MSEQTGLMPKEHMSNKDIMNEAIAKLNDQVREKRRRKKHGKSSFRR